MKEVDKWSNLHFQGRKMRRHLILLVFVLVGNSSLIMIQRANGEGTADEGIPASNHIAVVPSSVITGTLVKWHPVTVSFNGGPYANETDDAPNPFLDYRLQVTFTGPGGQVYEVPGFFAGDGQGHGSGNVWQVRFSPDQAGTWRYVASFRYGSEVAVDLNPAAGTSAGYFDGLSGTFTIAPLDCQASGFLKWGRLEYTGEHYLKFRDGGYWIKGGTNSPENFLAYKGFDNTQSHGGPLPYFLHEYAPHVFYWQSGDPYFVSADTGYDSRGIIGALNYLALHHVNSIYLLVMNLGGDGQDTYPFIGAARTRYDKTHYDISKLHQWNIVFEHAQRKGIALHIVLAETEIENEQWLDDGALGVERKLFFRELIARFSYLLALKWNLSEENDYQPPLLFEFANMIQALDWANHPIAVHTKYNRPDHYYYYFLGDSRFTATSIQYAIEPANAFVETWRAYSAAAGRPWILDMDENAVPLTHENAIDLSRQILYPVYFSGGNLEWYQGSYDLPLGGDLNLEDFSTREQMWWFTWNARRFMHEHLPFWEMQPADDLLTGEAEAYGPGHVFMKPGSVYAVHLPVGTPSGSLDLHDAPGPFLMNWYNPRQGTFHDHTFVVNGGGLLSLGMPPDRPFEDWVVLLTRPTANRVFGLNGMNTSYLPLVAHNVLESCPPGY